VDRLVPGQHCHALGDLPGARLGPLDGIDPADEGEAVGLVSTSNIACAGGSAAIAARRSACTSASDGGA
jgi:hypothetical protein